MKTKPTVPVDVLAQRIQEIFYARSIGRSPSELIREKTLFLKIIMGIIEFTAMDQAVRVDGYGSLKKNMQAKTLIKRQSEIQKLIQEALRKNVLTIEPSTTEPSSLAPPQS
jgi:hypothetical protein